MKKKIGKAMSFLSRRRIATKVLSMTLSLVLLFYVIPTVIYAEISDAFSSDGRAGDTGASVGVAAADGSDKLNEDHPLYEVNELREENVKHFRLADGSYVAAQYASVVHYLDEAGVWQDIDNTLSYDGSESFLTKDARIKFSKKINGSGKLLSLKNGDYQIDIGVVNGISGSIGESFSFADSETATELQKMLNLEKLSSMVRYPAIFSGADMEFLTHSNSIFKKITVNERSDSYAYSFEI